MKPTPTPTPLPSGVKIYVANHGKVGSSPSVTIYAQAATGNATPIATLGGSKTNMQQIQFPAVDASGDLFLSDAGAAGSATSGFVSTFLPTALSGNRAPASALGSLANPEGIAFDSKGDVYVSTESGILVYPPHPTPASTPLRTITLGSTQQAPYGLAIDSSNKLYVALSTEIEVFAANASGAATPVQTVGGSGIQGSGAQASGIDSCLSVAVDTSDNIYCANFNNSTITEYAAGSNGADVTPTVTATDPTMTSLDEPFGIFIDSSNTIYVANYGNNSISIFSATTLATGIATRRIVGTSTGLNFPYGIYVR